MDAGELQGDDDESAVSASREGVGAVVVIDDGENVIDLTETGNSAGSGSTFNEMVRLLPSGSHAVGENANQQGNSTCSVLVVPGSSRDTTSASTNYAVDLSALVNPQAMQSADINAVGVNTTTTAATDAANVDADNVAETLATPPLPVEVEITPPSKKRKRGDVPNADETPTVNERALNDEEDDGCTCSICFDHWEMSGEHRLASLRCGHLFGDSCIRRWLRESAKQSNGQRVCPQCKSTASPRNIRYIFAKRVRAIDRTEEHQLRKKLSEDRDRLKAVEIELHSLQLSYKASLKRINEQDLEIIQLRRELKNLNRGNATTTVGAADADEPKVSVSHKLYKLAFEQNVSVTRERGCRVMTFSPEYSALLVSQNYTNQLFPGYGLRVLDIHTYRCKQFMRISSKMLRDIANSADEHLIACTSMEPTAKLLDLRTRETTTIASADAGKNLWACAMGNISREFHLYVGAQQGTTSVYDIRSPNNVVCEYETTGDLSPVIAIAVIPKNDDFPFGAVCVCKLQSLWLYEYVADGPDMTVATRLNIDGPFMSMNFERTQSQFVLTVRVSTRYPVSHIIVGKVRKLGNSPIFEVTTDLVASKVTRVMTRCCQIVTDGNTFVTGYMQDTKQLALFDVHRQRRLQSLPIDDVVYDTCSFRNGMSNYVAALTEDRCRIFQLTELP